MYLKAIEIHGFKSFANKTVFRFHNGVTAIVGPNGSGKSNVADAVRWVLGEQRVKQLRGGSMQDVIFAGTENRKMQGYASVSITLDNSDHALKLSYDEVTVTRRLYRSGESEYLLNGTQCRLKDINELFYDTGIGKEGYSIIGQGQIEKILSGKPEERRELFDEAVGIVKFKRRKAEAQKKLENEQANLTRVNDILSELAGRVGPLGKQAEKAKLFLKKKEALKAYDVNYFLFEFQDLKERIAQTGQTLSSAQQQLEEVQKETEQIRISYDEITEQLAVTEKEQADLNAASNDSRLKRQQCESRIELLRQQIATVRMDEQRAKERIEQIDVRTAENLDKIRSHEESLDQLRTKIAQLRTEDDSAREVQIKLRSQVDTLTRQIEQSKQQVIRILNERAQLSAGIERCDTLAQQNDLRRSQIAGQILRLQSEDSDQNSLGEKLRKEKEQLDAEIEELNRRSDEAGKELGLLQERLTDENHRMEADQQEYHRISSRLETLRNIAERYDGYGNSIRKVMERKGREPGLLGVVADLIKTDKKYETAIETALGGSIQNIVTADEETAKNMIAYLKTNRFGRATFLPLTAMKSAGSFNQTKALGEKGVIGLACDLVRADERYNDLVRYLLGRTVVVDTIDHAVSLARAYRYSLRIVTLEGDLMAPGGSMSGGAYKNTSNLLGRRREIEDLQKTADVSRQQLQQLREAIDADRTERNRLRDEIRQISVVLQEKYIAQNTARLGLAEAEGKQQSASSTLRSLTEEQEKLSREVKDIRDEKEKLQLSMEESVGLETAEQQRQNEWSQQAEQLRNDNRSDGSLIEQIHVELASRIQEEAFLVREADRVREENRELAEERRLLTDKNDVQNQIEAARQEIAVLNEEIQQADAITEQTDAALKEMAARREEMQRRQKDFFADREELTERSSLLDRECYRLSAQIERLEENRESRISYMWEEYELTYSAALSLKRDDLGSRNDWKKQMAVLKKEIKDLGNVNVNAIDEYKEVSEKYEFLSGQHEDLVKAEEALEKIIRQLDEGMRRQFRENFARIQEEFDKSFTQLFGGGKGTLALVDDADILEAGIRIEAQPPGKKLQNMMQLSGGEKALTAIALLFAIQNLKPSPFCLLDEIEAALDESNVERYAQYLHKLTKHTQFIIITHRRGTMAAADRLYGITMQEKGVSALVSVNLIEDELDL